MRYIFPFIVIIVIVGIYYMYSRQFLHQDNLVRSTPIILISIDTLRPDHLGCYGYSRRTSPAVDGLAEDGILFRTAIAQAPSTLPSHASILTARIPRHHGAFHSALARLSRTVPTLAEVLSEYGYRTMALHGGGQLAEVFGLDRGFDGYEQVRGDDFRYCVNGAIRWIQNLGNEPFFLFLHTYETHVPYRAGKRILDKFEPEYTGTLPDTITMDILDQYNFKGREINDQDLNHIVNAYDAAIFNMDRSLRRFIRFLKDEGVYDRSLIIFTSDHGEEFLERSKVGYHCHTVYDELIRVPLIMKLPGGDQGSVIIPEQVRSIDIMPTILDYLRIPHPSSLDGVGLIPRLTGNREAEYETNGMSRYAVSERDDLNGEHRIMSIRTNNDKLYVIKKNGTIVRRFLFDLGTDISETRNIVAQRSARADSLWEIYRKILRSGPIPTMEIIGLDGKTRTELQALGYMRN